MTTAGNVDDVSKEGIDLRRIFLLASVGLTLFGCFVSAFATCLVQWQIVELREFSAIHEHGIFWDCVSSEVAPLVVVRNAFQLDSNFDTNRWRRYCAYKFDSSAAATIYHAVEAGDAAAREMLMHRFLPQHKAVVFFTVFSFIFAGISIIIGCCSPCFIPNAVLHVISVLITMICSFIGDMIFILAAMRIDNRHVKGVVDVYYQRVGFAFYVHLSAAFVFLAATFCATIAAYLLLKEDYYDRGWCPSRSLKTDPRAYIARPQTADSDEGNGKEAVVMPNFYGCAGTATSLSSAVQVGDLV